MFGIQGLYLSLWVRVFRDKGARIRLQKEEIESKTKERDYMITKRKIKVVGILPEDIF